MTFPIDFWTHPKVSRLSDAAFRAFVEANGHSRMRETDGLLEPDDAEFLWKLEVLEELVRSHPSRPLMVRDDAGNYVLRDYAEHQFTKADRDELTEKRRKAGIASASKRAASVEHVLNTDQQEPTRIGIGIETSSSTKKREPATRGTRLEPDWLPSKESVTQMAAEAPDVDTRAEHKVFVDYWLAQPGQKGVKTNWESTWRNWMRRKQGDSASPKQSKAAMNAAAYRREFGDGSSGSFPALDPGVG